MSALGGKLTSAELRLLLDAHQFLQQTQIAARCVFMPRFYFHLFNDVQVMDKEGHDFPDLRTAHADALRQVRAMAAETAKDKGRIVLSHRVDIENAHRTVLATVYVRDAVTVED